MKTAHTSIVSWLKQEAQNAMEILGVCCDTKTSN